MKKIIMINNVNTTIKLLHLVYISVNVVVRLQNPSLLLYLCHLDCDCNNFSTWVFFPKGLSNEANVLSSSALLNY